jgi:hypothetical protein
MHRADHVLAVADQPDIDGIAGNALRGRVTIGSGEALLVLVMGPERRQHEIGEQAIGATTNSASHAARARIRRAYSAAPLDCTPSVSATSPARAPRFRRRG